MDDCSLEIIILTLILENFESVKDRVSYVCFFFFFLSGGSPPIPRTLWDWLFTQMFYWMMKRQVRETWD